MAEDGRDEVVIENYGLIKTGDEYREELRKELADLEEAEAKRSSEYKQQRIRTIRTRLGLPVGDGFS